MGTWDLKNSMDHDRDRKFMMNMEILEDNFNCKTRDD